MDGWGDSVSAGNVKPTVTSVYTVTKVAVLGALLSEAWYFAKAFRPSVAELIARYDTHQIALGAGLAAGALMVVFLCSQRFFHALLLVFKSGRADVIVAFMFGAALPIILGGVGDSWYRQWAAALEPRYVGMLLLVPIGLISAFFIGRLTDLIIRRRPSGNSFFISDEALTHEAQDLLGIADEAARFAERVFNYGSSMSLVFGIDAPWGIGKSSFINFCKRHWQERYATRVIVYDFSPLRYEGHANLPEAFIDGLVRAIQRRFFVPELRSLLSRYARFVRGLRAKVPLVDFELPSSAYNIDDAFEDLEVALLRLDKKVIVVVDDLDRLTLRSAKEVLYTVKKSFALPNLSYVLAYDTDNIGALEDRRPDAEKLTEFLEKFINVKIGIYLDSSALVGYVSKNLSTALSGNSQADPILVSKAIGGLIDILNSPDYHQYQAFVGDIRKIKRLINTLLLLEIDRADFENSDFNKEDLIHLLLIYVNYPNVFRTIYDSETQGRWGTFSLNGPYDAGYPGANAVRGEAAFKNSAEYERYTTSLRASQRFLLDKVFKDSERLSNGNIESVSEGIKRSYACFNGGGGTGRNLEQYLQLIVKLSKPQKDTQYQFYVNSKNKVAGGTPIEDVLGGSEVFAWSATEGNREHLWRVLVNSTGDLPPRVGKDLIRHLLDNIQDYCLFEDAGLGLGLRHRLPLYLLKLLDTVGWQDEQGVPRANTNENIREIAEWILCEGPYADNGVAKTLSKDDRGLLGLYDLLVFRLYCSADRGGDTFNVQRALSTHSSPGAPTSGLTQTIAIAGMREISQVVYRIFEEQYIRPTINIFDRADKLSLADFCGNYADFVDQKRASIADLDTRVEALRSVVKVFSIYQLGSARVEMGVPCGYYDSAGDANKQGIARALNDYLFDVCFNPAIAERNYEHFLDYLLMNLATTFGTGAGEVVANANEFTKVLLPDRLSGFWKANETAIRAHRYTEWDRFVHTGNYRASYRSNLHSVYDVLDRMLLGEQQIAP